MSEAPEGEVREAGIPPSTSPTNRHVSETPESDIASPLTFAHRGARLEEPENTIAAFRRALEAGVSGLETDVWLSADGEVVCVHDDVLRRGLRRIRVSSATADELAAFGVPRLDDVYAEL